MKASPLPPAPLLASNCWLQDDMLQGYQGCKFPYCKVTRVVWWLSGRHLEALGYL